jgi:hypothetical protein
MEEFTFNIDINIYMLSVDILYAQAKDCCISVRLEY